MACSFPRKKNQNFPLTESFLTNMRYVNRLPTKTFLLTSYQLSTDLYAYIPQGGPVVSYVGVTVFES